MTVIFQDKGSDFPPLVTSVEDRDAAVRYIVCEVAKAVPHQMETVTSDDARRTLDGCDSFSMTEKSGSQYVWTIQ